MPEEPRCPDCGAPMVLRLARRGANAGNQFYGCSRYSEGCRGTRPTDGDSGSDVSRPRSADFEPRVAYVDRQDRHDWETSYTIGGGRLRSSDAVSRVLHMESASARGRLEQLFMAASPAATPSRDPQVDQVVGTFRKILQRGDCPPLDPALEWRLLEDYQPRRHDPGAAGGDLAFEIEPPAWMDGESIRAALYHSAGTYRTREDLKFDSAEEVLFLRQVAEQFGHEAARWLYPQVEFSALNKDPQDLRRLDFLFSAPWSTPFAVEIDGLAHKAKRAIDERRDDGLRQLGIEVIRISAEEARLGRLEKVASCMRVPATESVDTRTCRLVYGPAFAARLGLALAEAIDRGWLPGASGWSLRVRDPLGITEAALPSLLELLGAIDELWAGYIAPSECIVDLGDRLFALERSGVTRYTACAPSHAEPMLTIFLEPYSSPMEELPATAGPTLVLRSANLPLKLCERRAEGASLAMAKDPLALEESLLRVLQFVFAKRSFREGQLKSLAQVLRRRDSLVLLPTGAGKSLIYQLAGLLLPGRTLVIDPIIALMEDQIESLRRVGIDRAIGLSSFTTQQGASEAALNLVQSGDALFFLVAPERLQQRRFRDALRALTVSIPVNLAVVDEAHCISEWGHDFRPSYLNLGPVLRNTCKAADGSSPPILALTGTASRAVLRDVLIELDLDRSDPDAIVRPVSFDREELTFSVLSAEPGDSRARLMGLLAAMPDKLRAPALYRDTGRQRDLGIVFCPFVNGDLGVEEIAQVIRSKVTPRVAPYSGKAPRGYNTRSWEHQKREIADRFRRGEYALLCATNAFGMGVDIPNVRFTIHYGLPGSIESFYQEAGRAGRDRRDSHCALVFAELDPKRNETLLTDATDRERARQLYQDYRSGQRDDVLNQLWFHFSTFRGRAIEQAALEKLLGQLAWTGQARVVFVPFENEEDAKATQERAILRLQQVGVVVDYLKDWGSRCFELRLAEATEGDLDAAFLRYVTRTQPARLDERRRAVEALPKLAAPAERALSLALMVNSLIYDTVEKSRRRALREMRLLAAESRGDYEIRQRIEDYFREGELAPRIEGLLEATSVVLDAWLDMYSSLTVVDEGELRGTTARFLESYPDHPGLLVGRALAELMGGGASFEFGDNLRRALAAGTESYGLSTSAKSEIMSFFLEQASTYKPNWRPLVWAAWDGAHGRQSECPIEDSVFRSARLDPGEALVLLSHRLTRMSAAVEAASGRIVEEEYT